MAKKYSPIAYQRRKARAAAAALVASGFKIDTDLWFQRIDTGMDQMDAMAVAAAQIAELPYEMSVLITPDGTVFASKGEYGTVAPPYDEVVGAGYKVSELVDLHNHPPSRDGARKFGGPPSNDDWSAMFRTGMYESYIVAPEGRYTLKAARRIDNGVEMTPKAKSFFDGGHRSQYIQLADVKYRRNREKYDVPGGYMKASYAVLQEYAKYYEFDVVFQPNPGWENLYS